MRRIERTMLHRVNKYVFRSTTLVLLMQQSHQELLSLPASRRALVKVRQLAPHELEVTPSRPSFLRRGRS